MSVTPNSSSMQAAEEAPAGSVFAQIFRAQRTQILLILVVLVVIFSVLSPGAFAQFGNIRLLVQNAAILAVLGVGMTYVITTGGIDLSAGSVLVFSGVVSALVMRSLGGQGWGVALVGAVVSVLVGLLWGTVNGWLVGFAKIPPLIATLGTMGASLGLAQVLTGGVDVRDVPDVLLLTVGYGNIGGIIPVLSLIAAIVVAIGAATLRFSRFGRYVVAIGSNALAARRVGIKVPKELLKIYALAGALSGLAGVLSLAQFGTTAIAGQSATVLNVIAAVVIGGTSLFGGIGTVLGTVIGLFIPAVLQNGFVITGVEPFWQQVAVGVVLVAAVYVDQSRRAAAARSATRKRRFSLFRSSRSPRA